MTRRTKAELKADLIVYLERRHNIEYNGMQERLRRAPLYLFTDKATPSTFGSEKLLDVADGINALRLKFKGGV